MNVRRRKICFLSPLRLDHKREGLTERGTQKCPGVTDCLQKELRRGEEEVTVVQLTGTPPHTLPL